MNRPWHEERDVSVRAILWTVAIGIVLAALVHVEIWFTFIHFRNVNEDRDFRRSQLEASEEPPRPRLQVSPGEDWERRRDEQTKELNSYGWVSREQGIVRIPIHRAMELIVQRDQSLPTSKENSQ